MKSARKRSIVWITFIILISSVSTDTHAQEQAQYPFPQLIDELKNILPKDSLFAFPDTHPDIPSMAYGRFNTLIPEDQHTGQILQRIRTLRTIGPGPAPVSYSNVIVSSLKPVWVSTFPTAS